MTTYQTNIQHPDYIRWGSAKIEVQNDACNWVDLGAIKGITATMTTSGLVKYKPDNCPPIIKDPSPETWDWEFSLEEAWNPDILKLLRGAVDTWTDTTAGTTIGVYAGTGSRAERSYRITNTTPGMPAAQITLTAAKVTSEYDYTFPTDDDAATAVALRVRLSAVDKGSGYGTIFVPKESQSP